MSSCHHVSCLVSPYPMLAAIVPVKRLAAAKSRLASILHTTERQQLVLAMLGDVLGALIATPGVDHIGVISADPLVLELARARGVEPLLDQASDLNAALGQASRYYAERGVEATLVLPADLPLITPAAIEQLAGAAHGPRGAAIVPSRDGGTNALLLRPPLALPFHFGAGSLARHRQAAYEHGLTLRVASIPGLHLDIDQPDDLLLLAEAEGATATQELLRELSASERVMCV